MSEAKTFHNPWRDFIENVISGDNYFRSSEYRELLEEMDMLYADNQRLTRALLTIAETLEALGDHTNLGRIARAALDPAEGASQ